MQTTQIIKLTHEFNEVRQCAYVLKTDQNISQCAVGEFKVTKIYDGCHLIENIRARKKKYYECPEYPTLPAYP